METAPTRQLLRKHNKDNIYLHSIFIFVILVCRPVFKYLYDSSYHFKWSMDYHPVVLLFYLLVLSVIYFTAFVILKDRHQFKRPAAIAIKLSGFIGMFFLFIPLRWFTDQNLSYWLTGITNYPKEVSLNFFFHDNIIISFSVMMAGLFLKFMNDWYLNDRIKLVLEKQNLQMELNFLKSQVNPHFLFNTLNNIQSYIVQDDKWKSIELIGRLSEFMRFSLYECNEEFIDLDKEISMLGDYIELERVRCDDRVKISFLTEGNFSAYKIPPLLLMPFVENAFKHGADRQMKESLISIQITLQNNSLYLKVENSFTAQGIADSKTGGIGLQNVKRRLQHYFPDKYTLRINEHEPVFKVNLSLTLDNMAALNEAHEISYNRYP